jgi:hypothetical protein
MTKVKYNCTLKLHAPWSCDFLNLMNFHQIFIFKKWFQLKLKKLMEKMAFICKISFFPQIMFDEQASHDIAKASLELFCDVEIFLGLTCIIHVLELVQGLSKFAHN